MSQKVRIINIERTLCRVVSRFNLSKVFSAFFVAALYLESSMRIAFFFCWSHSLTHPYSTISLTMPLNNAKKLISHIYPWSSGIQPLCRISRIFRCFFRHNQRFLRSLRGHCLSWNHWRCSLPEMRGSRICTWLSVLRKKWGAWKIRWVWEVPGVNLKTHFWREEARLKRPRWTRGGAFPRLLFSSKSQNSLNE